jgi:hypothetical protein
MLLSAKVPWNTKICALIYLARRLGMVAHIYNLSYTEGIGRRITVQGQPEQEAQDFI